MADVIKDVLMGKLFGGGGSSGSGGGGSAGVSPKEVNFYDYDGTCVHAYTVAEAQALSELPAGPEHPGLVFQGWNWSLEGVKGLTRAMHIGAMYTTDDGTTRLYITLQEGRTSPMLGVGVNGTVTVDWGDGSDPDTLTGTSTSTTKWTENHAYAAPGDYVIRLTADGSMGLQGSAISNAGSYLLRYSDSEDARNYAYQNALQKAEIGDNVTRFGGCMFYKCNSLVTVTVPNCVTDWGNSVFASCNNLVAVVVPDSATQLGSNAFASDISLAMVSIPNTVTDLETLAFSGCSALESVTIPDSVTSWSNSMFKDCTALTSMVIPINPASKLKYDFYNCNSLAAVVIPDSVTSVDSDTFCYCNSLASVIIPSSVTSIGYRAFGYCSALASVVFLGSVATIGQSAFLNCYGMACYDFTACTAVPTLSATSAFSGIPADCEIRVPAALYDEWIAATNWSTYADYIKAY